MTNTQTVTTTGTFMTPAQLLTHWQQHRNLTRKLIAAFPEDKLFSYSIGGMRPFAELVMEFLGMGVPGLQGVLTGKWDGYKENASPATQQELIDLWDEHSAKINQLWQEIPAEKFDETVLAFGQWEGKVYWTIMYFIDNEIHHRGQGYVYLRSLGIEPPAFWDRA